MDDQITSKVHVTDRGLVDSIVYLASLASQPSVIDPALDELRLITTTRVSGTPLVETERATLQRLIANLKNYLVTSDPLRSFTSEALEQKMQANLRQSNTPQISQTHGFTIIAFGCVILAALTLVIPSTPSLQSRIFLAIPIFLMLTTLANAWLYLSSLGNFKPELRQVFWYLCGGTIGLGMQFLHFAYIPLSGEGQLPLYKYGGLPVIAFISFVFMYFGLCKYASLLKLNSRYTAIWRLGVVLVFATALAVLAAYMLSVHDTGYLVFSLGSVLGISATSLFGSRIALGITHNLTTVYAKSIRRLYIFLTAVFVGAIGYALAIVVAEYLHGGLSGDTLNIALGICATPPLLFLLHSGYSFKRETSK